MAISVISIFVPSDTAIDSQGNIYHGLSQDKYAEVLIKNADGIDIRQGCHDILIENITGFTEDDMVAVTGLNGLLEKTFAVTSLSSNIYNITIKNLKGAAFCSIVRLLNQDGIKLHDIVIDSVEDTSNVCPYLDKGGYAVRVGDTHLYGARQSTKEEIWNINITRYA